MHRISILLLLAFPLITTVKVVCQTPMEIKYNLLKIKAKDLPIEGITTTFRKLKELQNGSRNNKQTIIIYNDKEYTLSQMVSIEQSLEAQNMSPLQRKQENERLKDALNKAIENINPFIDPFKESIKKKKGFIKPVIAKWAEQRQRKDTLTPWLDLPEKTFIAQNFANFKLVGTFVEDLATLLIDVLHTVSPKYAQKLLDDIQKAQSATTPTAQKEEL